MAAQVALDAAEASIIANQDIQNFFTNSLNDISEQLSRGVQAPVVPFTKLQAFGISGIPFWQGYIQGMLNQRFTHQVDLFANTVTLHPLEPMPMSGDTAANGVVVTGQTSNVTQSAVGMPAEASLTASNVDNAQMEVEEGRKAKVSLKDKIPRPPNSFIIYRQEWHARVVEQHPNLHNNDISKIIARKWKAETEAVRDEYKRKAEDAKRQHAIAHPGYQYQPRKSFEKKKRMTKNKLAKLKAQANAGGALDPMMDLNGMVNSATNDKQAMIDAFQAPYRQGFPNLQPSQEVNNHLTFDAIGDTEMQLHNQLVRWNAENPLPLGGLTEPAVLIGQPLAGGQKTIEAPQHNVPYSFTQASDIYDTNVPGTVIDTSAKRSHDAITEIERQNRIAEDSLSELFNFEACASPIAEGDDAESILQNFQSSYTFDFE